MHTLKFPNFKNLIACYGGGSWDADSYRSSASLRSSKGIDDFAYDKDVKSGKVHSVHPSLDPTKVAGPTSPLSGQNVRESRDSDEHPDSIPIAAFFDVTGSMGRIPLTMQKKLVNLMDVIKDKVGMKDPQILVGAIGDSYSDKYPFQVGQFESDNRFEETLRSIILEGNGGGQNKESYGLAWYFGANCTATDAWDKRGKKGYFITMGDESLYPTVTSREIQKIFGIGDKGDVTVEELLDKMKERWEVFHLCALEGSYPNDDTIHHRWEGLLGERYVKVEHSDLICETIAGLIHGMESASDIDTIVADIGLSGSSAASVKRALIPVIKSNVPTHVAKGSMPTKKSTDSGVSRI